MMAKKSYQLKVKNEKKIAKACATNEPVSLKYATEMCREIKGKPVDKIEAFLQRIIKHEDYLPLRRYVKKMAHRKGDAKSGTKTGKYPEKLCKSFLNLIESAKANADFKGLDTENLLIYHAFASMGFRRFSAQPKGKIGGKRRRKKSAHIEIMLIEGRR